MDIDKQGKVDFYKFTLAAAALCQQPTDVLFVLKDHCLIPVYSLWYQKRQQYWSERVEGLYLNDLQQPQLFQR